MKTKWGGYRAAQRTFRADQCSVCGSTTHVHRHHLDMNPQNNAQDNIRILCVKCHAKAHVTMEKGRNVRSRPCAICGKTFRPTRSRRGRVCSSACLREMGRQSAAKRWTGHSKQQACAYCGKVFVRTRARQETCSRSCGNKRAWEKRGGKASLPSRA